MGITEEIRRIDGEIRKIHIKRLRFGGILVKSS